MRDYEIKYNEYEEGSFKFLGVRIITIKTDTESNAISEALKLLTKQHRIATLINIEHIPKETDENFWKDNSNRKRKVKKI